MSIDDELPPSKLGTKAHWDEVYDREVRVFRDVGDEGEVWFGNTALKKMRSWADNQFPVKATSTPYRIMECGTGNGTLLLSFLTSKPPRPPRKFHLTGTDYSLGSITLAQDIEQSRRSSLPLPRSESPEMAEEEDQFEEEVVNDCTTDWRVVDLLRHDFEGETWDMVLDKGTYDALCLSDDGIDEEGGRLPSVVYPEKVAKTVADGGLFCITSCNFTEEEIKARYTVDGLGFEFHSSVPHASFSFGGAKGTTVCTVAFRKIAVATEPPALNGLSLSNGHGKTNGHSDTEPLYICVDCGGTKTDIAIASKQGVIARAIGGTGNMAEVGLQLSYEIIAQTTLEAIANLPERYQPKEQTSNGGAALRSPITFADVWVGISGCDTQYDQDRMAALLRPFFGMPKVAVYNDAHLLGGGLLKHHRPWGVAVIAGTGSVVIALEVDEAGEVQQIGRRGGVGYLLGDDGSAFDLGRSAIRAAFDDFDADEEVRGGLADTIKAHFGVKSTGEVLAKVYDLDPTLSPHDSTNVRKLRISSLSIPILKAFTSDPPDALAIRAVHQAAQPLVDSIISLVRQLERTGRNVNDAALLVGGGVIRQDAYRDVVRRGLEDGGVEFGLEAVAEDVAGEGAEGLVERAKEGGR